MRNQSTKDRKKYIFIIFLMIIFLMILIACTYIFSRNHKTNIKIADNTVQNDDYDDLPDLPEWENKSEEEIDALLQKLSGLAEKDVRINKIIKNYKKYPPNLLGVMINNIEIVDFLIDYPYKRGNIYSDNVGEVEKGKIPHLLQWDERWGYAEFANATISEAGCGPTALSMVLVGLTGDNTLTPYKVGKYATENGYYNKKAGTSWSFMTDGADHFGVKGEVIILDKETIYNYLENGKPIICSVKKGDFTLHGHFIVLVGIQDGLIKVYDPNSIKLSNKLWDYNELYWQITNLWVYSVE